MMDAEPSLTQKTLSATDSGISTLQRIGLPLGPLLFMAVIVSDPVEGMGLPAWQVVGIVSWMAAWWATEAIPIPITSLLPLVLIPAFGEQDISTVAGSYTNSVVYLLLAGFILALGLQRWNIHRRVALAILVRVGENPLAIIGGFMLATAFLSMWVSNTASTLMIIPIALSVATTIAPNSNSEKDQHNFTIALVLSIAYSASIGGLGTLIGTPPNLLMAGYMRDTYGIDISFIGWLAYGLPVVIVMLPLCWLTLTKIVYPFKLPSNREAHQRICQTYRKMGKLNISEKRMSLVFVLVVLLWVTRPLLVKATGYTHLSDTAFAVIGAITLFLVPSGKGGFLMNWDYAKNLPWDVLLIYGGGMAIASAMTGSGLSEWLGSHLVYFSQWHIIFLISAITVLVIFLTELTNNSATVATFLPVLGAIALSTTDNNPLFLAAPAVIAASCAFMLPVATPPNAVVYGTGQVTLPQMARAGVVLNMFAILVIPIVAYYAAPLLFVLPK